MGSKIRSGAVALAVAVALSSLGACGAGDDEAPGTASGSGNANSEQTGNDGSGHSGKHKDKDKDKEKEGGGTGQPQADQVIEVAVSGGRVSGVGSTVEVALGGRVDIEVAADTEDEVHVHGYDILRPVSPSKPARLRFLVDLPGAWEVELENSGLLLFELRVQ